MFNPINALGAGLKGISMLGKGVGKAQKVLKALGADLDADGTPEYKEALDGLLAMWHKAKDETLPKAKKVIEAVKQHVAEYQTILVGQVIPNVKAVFEAARAAAHLEE